MFNESEVRTKIRTYRNMSAQNAYLSGSAYLKRVSKRKVKVRLNRSKSCKVSLDFKILPGNPVYKYLISIQSSFFASSLLKLSKFQLNKIGFR